MQYEIHEAATLFPMMDEKSFAEFKQDISINGLKEFGTLYCNKVLDGRNRYRACQELGLEMTFCEIEDDGSFDPIAYVLSHNLHRRHLTESQRAMVAGKLSKMKQGDNQHVKEVGPIGPTSVDSAADALNVSPRSVKRARKVQADGSEAVNKAVEQGELAVSAAAMLVDAVPDKAEQDAIIANKATKPVVDEVKKAKAKKPSAPKDVTKGDNAVSEFLIVWSKANATGKRAIWLWLVDNYEGTEHPSSCK